MTTQSVDTIYLNKEDYKNEMVETWKKFLDGDRDTFLRDIYITFKQLLINNNWMVLENNLVYDNNIKACWYGICQEKYDYKEFYSGINVKEVEIVFKKIYKKVSNISLPTFKELNNSLVNVNPDKVPFETYRYSSSYKYSLILYTGIYKNGNITQNYDFGNYNNSNPRNTSSVSPAIPLLRLTSEDNFDITNRETFFRFVTMGLIPSELKDDKQYLSLIKDYRYTIEDFFVLTKVELTGKLVTISKNYLIDKLLQEDKLRANLTPYNHKMLEDIDQGHWSLWDMEKQKSKNSITATLNETLVARDPASSINDGVVGIDFGTKSTVVVYQKDNVNIHPMRIGTGELDKAISSHHYENPTIMEFNDLDSFIGDYIKNKFRPFTKWDDLTISHTAHNSLMGSASKDFNTFLDELKQWAGDKNRQLKIIDKKSKTIDLPPFLSLEEQFNPIEIYAYYLGLNINNQYNGIYLNYILSFPVTYEKAIRDKILDSFKKGIKKSLPSQLKSSYIEKLSVESGASEPAAYAIVALDEYEFDPRDDERVFYGVFDFGGGTTDFDFGIYREANGAKEKRYDYAIEHFGAGGDRYLGGENLLELLAFEIFKKNKDTLLLNSIQFEKHPEKDIFAGAETLLSNSREAKLNTKILVEELRGFWENDPDKKDSYDSGVLSINLTDINGKQIVNFELNVIKDELYNILYRRIEKGVTAFFEQLRIAFSKQNIDLSDIKKINIFLAGNSSKSNILKEIFNKEIEKQENLIKENNTEMSENIFELFEPLESDDNDIEKPTGKTGVAFGLIKSRKSGKVLVLDHNMGEDIDFKYYLGHSKKKNFRVDIDRETPYNKWIDFIDASINQFEIFYTTNPTASTNKLPIDDDSVKKLILDLDVEDENALVYIRLVSPTEIEYVVAPEDKIEMEDYMSEVKKISLGK